MGSSHGSNSKKSSGGTQPNQVSKCCEFPDYSGNVHSKLKCCGPQLRSGESRSSIVEIAEARLAAWGGANIVPWYSFQDKYQTYESQVQANQNSNVAGEMKVPVGSKKERKQNGGSKQKK